MTNKYLKLGLSLLIILLFSTHCDAQNYERVKGDGNVITDTRQVGNFDNIGVSGSFDVDLVKGKEGKVTINIEKNLLPYLVTVVKDGKLKIKWKKGTRIRTRKGVHLIVYFNDINGVSVVGSGDIVSKDLIKSDRFEVSIVGSGDINLNIEANSVEARVSGSGDLDLEGSATNFDARVSGSGNISAYGLQTDKSTLRVSGSGDITISVKNELNAKVSGSGDIGYKGNPKIEDIKVSGSGGVSSK
ncbi:MAG: DUF2807 domain-containing protein [Flavobacteriaceae bacterium]|nr:DUF2807 domain-containing protein [Flavobacteriaceae bacterium]